MHESKVNIDDFNLGYYIEMSEKTYDKKDLASYNMFLDCEVDRHGDDVARGVKGFRLKERRIHILNIE